MISNLSCRSCPGLGYGAGAILAVSIVAGVSSGALAPGDAVIESVPTPAHLVSGGDTLVRISSRSGADLAGIAVRVNGVDATSAFKPAPADPLGGRSRSLLGRITGLKEGSNTVAVLSDGKPVGELPITNYPLAGPIFSGPHLEPYFCLEDLTLDRGRRRRFAIGNGEFITGGKLDADCSLPTRVDYVYKTTAKPPARAGAAGAAADDDDAGPASLFRPLKDPKNLPSDVAQTTISSGATVPFVVRLETGTINRAIYQFAVLVDPDRPAADPWSPPRGWNGRLIYTFGGGCEAGFFQGTSTAGVLRDAMLAKGYAVASSTLNVNAQGGCNDPLSAETAMMVKEKVAETIGVPVHTIGNGGSGGAMQQLLIAGAYPGILDGIMPTSTFPDAVTYFIDSEDCRMPLRRYLNAATVDDETKRVVGGWATWSTCDQSLGNRTNRISPFGCTPHIPEAARYHPVTNPTGVRCSIYDAMRAVFGTGRYSEIQPSPKQAFGRSPHDNVGVQYGLEALNQGKISKELFLDLNEKAGGWDIDYQPRSERTAADPEAVRIAYETGRVTSGTGGLASTPIIDERGYVDKTGNFHTSYYSFIMRERLIRDNGHADNYIIERRPAAGSASRADENLALMDEWLTKIARDPSAGDRAAKVVRNRPAALTEGCWTAEGTHIREPQLFDKNRLFDNTKGRCNELYPPHTGPRMVAGGPLTNDILKCELKPLARSDYDVTFTDTEWSRLQKLFPGGVCDWSKPGVGQVPTRTWLSFGPSPVNRYRATSGTGN